MEVILIKDMENLGYANDIVNVKPGYANNYLIPQGYAKSPLHPPRRFSPRISSSALTRTPRSSPTLRRSPRPSPTCRCRWP